MSNYIASVITPFHNTDISMFKNCYKGMLKQSIGFEKIQWIIVFHNCDRAYIDSAKEVIGNHPNIEIKELVNESRSASSPRNYGLQFVKTPYLGFLDSDDYYTPECVEKCVEVLSRNKAQIVTFRLEFEKQNDKVRSLVTEQGIWNPLDEEVVLTHEQINDPRLTSAFILSSQAKFYDADFLNKENLRFDEKMAMSETAMFVTACYIKAEKIVSLPRFIGYHYFINQGSAIQTACRDRLEIRAFAECYKKMFEQVYNGGLYYNHNYVFYLRLFIHYMLSCKNFTKDDWDYSKELLMPYVNRISIPPVNKLYGQKEGEDIYNTIKTVFSLSFEELKNHSNNELNSERILLRIINDNIDSDFGNHYNFKDIKSIKDYQKQVPILNEEEYQELVRIQTNVGEYNVLTNKIPENYLYSFDSNDNLIFIPINNKDLKHMSKIFMSYIENNVNILIDESLANHKILNDNVTANSLDGTLLNNTIGKYSLSAGETNFSFTSPYSLIFPCTSLDNAIYLNILYALRNKEVTQIVAGNLWSMLNFCYLLNKYFKNIVTDIENGTISFSDNMSNNLKDLLSDLKIADRERAQELININKDSIKLTDIWPKLRRIVTITDSDSEIYLDKIKDVIKGVELVCMGSIDVFGYIGYPTKENKIFRLNNEDGYIEFKLFGSNPLEIKTISQIEVNKIYELIITNNSGLYRYESKYYVQILSIQDDEVIYKRVDGPIMLKDRVITSIDIYNILNEVLGNRLFDYAYHYYNKLNVVIETIDNKLTKEEKEKIISKLPVDAEIILNEAETQLFRRDNLRMKHNCPIDSIKPIRHIEGYELFDKYDFTIKE